MANADTLPAKSRPKWTRTGTPRSKSGCLTCKRRRLKCDEGLPRCQRCIKFGISCEYMPRLADRRALATLPKLQSKASLVTIRLTGINYQETEIEHRYLQNFQKESQSGLYNITDWSVWNQLVMQISHSEPFVRQFVIAIGALNKALQATNPWGPQGYLPTPDLEAARVHREFAFMEYGKAVKLMRSTLSNSSDNPRQALIACLLVICFEMFLGDGLLAFQHAETGLQILHQWQAKNYLWSDKNRIPFASPAPEVIEDEIIEAFANLDIKITTLSDPRPSQLHQMRKAEDERAVQNMPTDFKNLREARMYWNAVVRRACHFLATTWSPTRSSSLAREFDCIPPNKISVMTGNNIFSTSYEVSDDLQSAQRIHAEEVHHWIKAFDQLYQDIQRQIQTMNQNPLILAATLRIQCLAGLILISGVLFTEERMYDQFYTEFREMLDLMSVIATKRQELSGYTSWNGGFLIDLGIVPCLFIIVLRCRDPNLRRRALELLKRWQIEACWDPRLVYQIGLFMMEVEEEGMIDGHIPQKSRAIFSKISQDFEKRVALMQCVLKNGGPRGGKIWREKFVSW